MTSPWWYRRRSAVFALIYLAGFVGGWLVSPGRHYEAAFATLGRYLGPSGGSALLAAAALFTAGCLFVRAWGSSYLSAALVWNANAKTDTLVSAGPFRYLRHPLYFGNVLLAIGFGLLAPVPGMVFIFVANAAFISALMHHEEELMLRRYGDAFRAYCMQVPAIVPRLKPAAGNSMVHASLKEGVLSELFTASLCAGLFAWVLVPVYGVYIFIALYAAGVLAQRAVERRS